MSSELEIMRNQQSTLEASGHEGPKRFSGFTPDDAKVLLELRPTMEPHVPRIVDRFYQNVDRYPDLVQIISDAGSTTERLKTTLRSYILDLFGGVYEDEYFAKRLAVGKMHSTIGLGPRYYLGSFSIFFSELAPIIERKYRFQPEKRGKAIRALNRILTIDSVLAIENYNMSLSESTFIMLDETRASIASQVTGAAQQAASVNETTSTLEEIRATSQQTMEKATLLGDLSAQTQEEGKLGMDNIAQSIEAMNALRDKVEDIASTILALSEQTKQIGEITAVVNNIAQQSKMLALNASIEATKAGEAGKGFSVVAAEVRSLAEQSEESTGQVQKILLNIQNATYKAVMATEEGSKKAGEGVGLIESTGAVIGNLSEVIDEASVASQQIVAAVQQEAIGIDQASTGMVEINNVIQQFVSTSEQIGASVDRLGEELTSQSASKG